MYYGLGAWEGRCSHPPTRYDLFLAHCMQPLGPLSRTIAFASEGRGRQEWKNNTHPCVPDAYSVEEGGDFWPGFSGPLAGAPVAEQEDGRSQSASAAKCTTYSEVYAKSLAVRRELSGHRGCVNSLALDAANEFLLSGSDDLALCLYDTTSWELRQTYRTTHHSNIFHAVFVPGRENHVMSCELNGCTLLTDLETNQAVYKCRFSNMSSSIATSPWWPDTAYIAYDNGLIARVDTRFCTSTNEPTTSGGPHLAQVGDVRALAVHEQWPFLLASGTNTEYVYLHDVRMASLGAFAFLSIPRLRFCDGISGLSFSSSGHYLAVNYRAEDVYVLPWLDALHATELPKGHAATTDGFSPILSVGSAHSVAPVRVRNAVRLKGRVNKATMFKEVAFMEDDSIVCSGSDDGRIFFWKRQDGTLLHTTPGDSSIVNVVLYSQRAGCLLASGIDATVKVLEGCKGMNGTQESDGAVSQSLPLQRAGLERSTILRLDATSFASAIFGMVRSLDTAVYMFPPRILTTGDEGAVSENEESHDTVDDDDDGGGGEDESEELLNVRGGHPVRDVKRLMKEHCNRAAQQFAVAESACCHLSLTCLIEVLEKLGPVWESRGIRTGGSEGILSYTSPMSFILSSYGSSSVNAEEMGEAADHRRVLVEMDSFEMFSLPMGNSDNHSSSSSSSVSSNSDDFHIDLREDEVETDARTSRNTSLLGVPISLPFQEAESEVSETTSTSGEFSTCGTDGGHSNINEGDPPINDARQDGKQSCATGQPCYDPLFARMENLFLRLRSQLLSAFRLWRVQDDEQVQKPRWEVCMFNVARAAPTPLDEWLAHATSELDVGWGLLRRHIAGDPPAADVANTTSPSEATEAELVRGNENFRLCVKSLILIMDIVLNGKEFICVTTKQRRRYWIFRCLVELSYAYYFMAIGEVEMAMDRVERLDRHVEYRCITALGSVNRDHLIRQKQREKQRVGCGSCDRACTAAVLPRVLDASGLPPLLVPVALQIRILVLYLGQGGVTVANNALGSEDTEYVESADKGSNTQWEKRLWLLVREIRYRLNGHPNRKVGRKVVTMLQNLGIDIC
uniref:Guanine nucleotide-binding protein subunit beta-like protein n=1 Tax=Trypanosoma vivax (strain Y486) TaxID=1055687 RepID=G0U025_TRYVY|nr:conserved hypothetical protein [Trypanosoma vivax Y486]